LADDKKTILSKYCPELEAIPEQHISLSRTVYLKEHQLDPFVKSVRKLVLDIESFTLSFAQIAQLTNDEKTRSFVTLEVGNGYNEVNYANGHLLCLYQARDQKKRWYQMLPYVDIFNFSKKIGAACICNFLF
jgi:hypothetical protein